MALLCVARLISRKGIEDIIQALTLLPAASLTVVGSGPAESELRALATRLGVEDRVLWLGQVDHAGLPPIYREASVYVLPSRNEGMSNTVLEALASGLPVLLTATGGTEELLREGDNGFRIRAGHPEDIVTRVAHYAAHPDERVRHGNASRAIAERMSWRAVADAYMDVYRRIAGAA
jgi:glycosyltransferase involved in cell wall biosynthesis